MRPPERTEAVITAATPHLSHIERFLFAGPCMATSIAARPCLSPLPHHRCITRLDHCLSLGAPPTGEITADTTEEDEPSRMQNVKGQLIQPTLSYFPNNGYDIFMKSFVTTTSAQTKKLGEILAQELLGGEIICLSGDLGAGKTTFAQGLLKGLKIKGPHTSPTFAIMKHYSHGARDIRRKTKPKMFQATGSMLHDIYHIDAYRINAINLKELGFKDFAGKLGTVTIVEWAERVKGLIPKNSVWISFNWISRKERQITLDNKE
jgi:tRNA threonylcarbamoyladenosine biosynthesis protein TsaE